MSERNPGEIPESLKPLVEARTAHDAVRATLDLVRSTRAELQPNLISDQLFISVVHNILGGLDECRRDHAIEIISSFDKEFHPRLFQLFLDPLN